MNTPPTGPDTRPTDPRTNRTGRRATGYELDGLGPLLVKLQQQALTQLHLVANDTFLDIGCATGAAVRVAATHAHLAVGVDHSPKMIKHGRCQTRPGTYSHYTVAQAEHLPFPSHTFTAVLCTTVLHYLDDPRLALAEIARVLRPDGRLVIGNIDDLRQTDITATDTPHVAPRARTTLTVIHRQRTLTPLGPYTILLARPTQHQE